MRAISHCRICCCGTTQLAQGVRQKNFSKVRKAIEGSLFAAKPTFAPHLREVWGYASELRHVSFTNANTTHLYQLQEWADLQVGCMCMHANACVLAFASVKAQEGRGRGGQDGVWRERDMEARTDLGPGTWDGPGTSDHAITMACYHSLTGHHT